MDLLLSIVTVSLNAAATIERTLASVALQELNFGVEHICIDGGSSDATRSIIDRWASRDSRIVRMYGPDKGIFDAMNKGLGAARGEYVLFLNADDFLVARDSLALALTGCVPGDVGNPDLIVGDAVMGYTDAIPDIALLQHLGVDSYRFSMEWARIEPQKGHIDESALQHYSDVLDALHSDARLG